ncbi:hypothetical protein LLF88_01135 [bacterium]|nr:hypothetical protein [bacterium]
MQRAALRGPVVMLCLGLLLSMMANPRVILADVLSIGAAVEVTGTGGDGVNVRSSPGTSEAIVGVEKEGASGIVLEGPTSASGFIWWRVQWKDGLMGWSVDTYLRIPPPSPIPSAPTSLQAVAGMESVVLSWAPPDRTGTAPITAWRIYRDRHADPKVLIATLNAGDSGFDTRTWTDGPMIIGGRSYWYAISAVNANGASDPCASVQVVPQAAPMPTGVFFMPPQLDFGGEQTSLVLTLQNTGTAPVAFTTAVGASWLASPSPASGSIPVGAVQPINITVQRLGMAAGTYESLVRISCSTGSVNIPVQMRVGMIQGIDVSRWQCGTAPVDWTAVKASGIQFAFVKATEGTTITDPCLDQSVTGAKAAGVLTGVYHVCEARDHTAADEAAYFLQVAGKYLTPGSLAPVLDIEGIGYCASPWTAMVQWIDQWATAVRAATGVVPVIYCCSSIAANLHKADPTIDERYHLWIAAYTSADQLNIGGWSSWSFWQYANNGIVPGVTGHVVDLDCFNGNEQSLAQYVIGGTMQSSYTLLSAVIGNGLLNVEPQQTSYSAGSTVTFTARPAAGWEFVGWGGSATGTTNPMSLTMNENKSVLATFEKTVDPNQHVITLSVGSMTAHLDGQALTLDTPPVIISGRTLVPLRPIIEGLGGGITWVPDTHSVQVDFNETTLLLQIGNRTAVVNGESVVMDVPATIMNGRTMLPVRFVSEHLGAEVSWHEPSRTVTITVNSAATSGLMSSHQ